MIDSVIKNRPFRYWCQKVLPLVYDDSLSYYELLGKVVDYINGLLEDDENVINKVNELEQYINDYFTNLSVQEEINNKLDEMAQSGELGAIFAQYISPTIDELRDDLNDSVENITGELTNHQNQINVLGSRMDTFASLPDGSLSTTADAELVDIRVDSFGTTHPTAGDSVRSQVTELNVEYGEMLKAAAPSKLDFVLGAINASVVAPSVSRAYTKVLFPVHTFDIVYAVDNKYEYTFGTCENVHFSQSNPITWRKSWTTDPFPMYQAYDGLFGVILVRLKSNPNADISANLAEINESIKYISTHDSVASNGLIGSTTNIYTTRECYRTGWYGFGASDRALITDLPVNFPRNSGGTLFSVPFTYKTDRIANYVLQILYDNARRKYTRILNIANPNSPAIFSNWKIDGFDSLVGKNVAIIGDSISTNGNTGTYPNVPELTVQAEDVGVQLRAYLTYYDVLDGLSLGGHTFTESEIGNEVTFVPTEEDIGKSIGVPSNYNPNSTTVWWEVAQAELGFNPIPVCWSGASITSHEGNKTEYKTSYAWHHAQIRKCGIRVPGTMNRIDPDVVLIYRGTNDMTHSPYTRLTEGYFDNYNWQYPVSDEISNGVYGYKEGLCKTIQAIRTMYPNAVIMLCTLNTFKRINYSHYPTNNGINSLPQYNDAIREVAEFMGCSTIEFDKDGITFENCYSQGYITDSETIPTHPSNKGHKVMGNKAIADIKAKYNSMQ